ncbi:MAG: DUF4826 family protein [Alphaproteobacteria bacterium]|nr:DUF4826 family protein [Alphaproteobacteria bacterium]
MIDDELEAWSASERQKVMDYLRKQEGLTHGAVGDWPAWRLATRISVWAVESVRSPGAIGWWVICGDLPTDYCSGGPDCRIPRAAVGKLVQRWRDALSQYRDGDPTIGDLGIQGEFAPLLRTRVEALSELLADDANWPDEPF